MSPTAKTSGSLVLQRCVDEHAAVGADRQARRLGEVGILGAPTATRTASASTADPSLKTQAGRRTISGGDLLNGRPESQIDAVIAVQLGEHLGDLAAERAEQWQLGRLDHGDLRAALPGIGGHLETDPATAYDREREIRSSPRR